MFSPHEQQILCQIEDGLRADDRRFCLGFARQQRAIGWAWLVVAAWLLAVCAITHVGIVLGEVAEGALLVVGDLRSVARRLGRRHPDERRAGRAATV
jgi:Protein of unknown function (DUF3040)